MKGQIVFAVGGAVLVGITLAGSVWIRGPVQPLFASSQPVSEEQLIARLRDEGYSNISIEKQGYYLKATVRKDGRESLIAVDSRDGAPANHWVEDED